MDLNSMGVRHPLSLYVCVALERRSGLELLYQRSKEEYRDLRDIFYLLKVETHSFSSNEES